MSLTRELEVALATARAAAALVHRIYERGFQVADKGGGDPVTEADYAANAFILEALRRDFPGDAVCDEEGHSEAAAQAAARGGRCWFVDPLDGTREFVRKSGEFATMIGLAIDGQPRLGVVSAPVWQRTFAAADGHAFELDPDERRRPLRVAALDGRPPRVVLSRLHKNPAFAAAARTLGATDFRECGSFGLKLMLIAAGEIDLFLHTGPGPKLWDGCAPHAIAEAAGATVTDIRGRPINYNTSHLPLDNGVIVTSNEKLHKSISTLIST